MQTERFRCRLQRT